MPAWTSSIGRSGHWKSRSTRCAPTSCARARRCTADGLDPAAVARQFPQLRPTAGGLAIDEHGYLAAAQATAALARAAERAGATFRSARVSGIERTAGRLRATTTSGALEADWVVLAAGAWTNAVTGVRTPPMRPVRGQLVRVAWTGAPLTTIMWGPDCYVVPWSDGSLLVGATLEDAGFDERTTEEGTRGLLRAVSELLPALEGTVPMDARVGLRPATPDALPAIGPDATTPRVVHASGHYRNGILLAPITAHIVAGLIVDGVVDPAFGAFSPSRF